MTLHQVTPARQPVEMRLRPPGSKSITIRALAAGALASGISVLHAPLEAEDTQAMRRAMTALGAEIEHPTERWSISGVDGRPSPPGSPIDAGESGLTARIAMAVAALVSGKTVITGRGRLPRRPLMELAKALKSLGAEVRTSGGGLPAEIIGRPPIAGGEISVDCSASSQFATAIMLIAPLFESPTRLRLRGLGGSTGYLEVTRRVIAAFGGRVEAVEGGFEIASTGFHPAEFEVEPDASAAAYPLVAAAITGGRVEIRGIALDSAQPDIMLVARLEEMGCEATGEEGRIVLTGPEQLIPIHADMAEAPDASLALAVACLFAEGESRIRGLGSLRHKESDRLRALTETFEVLGAEATVEGDELVVTPGRLRGGVVDSHGDHRIAMALSLVGLRVPGVAIARAGVVSKTWPGYWSVLEEMAGDR